MDTMNLGSSRMDYCGKSMNVEKKRTKTKTFLLPEDQVDFYLSYEVLPIPRTLVEQDPAEGARLEKIRERVIVELDRMRREYQATGFITYELEVTDDGQEEVEVEVKVKEKEKENQVEVEVEKEVEQDAAAVRPPIISVGRSSRRRFRQGIVKRAGGYYEKIV